MNHRIACEFENVRLRPLAHHDLEWMRAWRNDPENSKYLSALPYITQEMQEAWFQKYLADQDVYSWAIDEIGILSKCVGSVSLYNFREDICETGKILVEPASAGKGIGSRAETLSLHIGFTHFHLARIDSRIRTENIPALKKARNDGLEIVEEIENEKGQKYFYLQAKQEDFYRQRSYLRSIPMDSSL
jgi:RimJ/RimL family protein N-acetyltransferase